MDSLPDGVPIQVLDLVIHFDEPYHDDLHARLATIEALLRDVVKSNAIAVIKAEPGSPLNVFVSGIRMAL